MKELNLSEAIMKKYDEFSFSKAIDSMDDYTWCPRQGCDGHAEVDKTKNMGFC